MQRILLSNFQYTWLVAEDVSNSLHIERPGLGQIGRGVMFLVDDEVGVRLPYVFLVVEEVGVRLPEVGVRLPYVFE